MTDYIDREEAYRFAQDQLKKETGAYSMGWNHAMNVMKSAFHNNDALPAADVVPVRHGRWISEPGHIPHCSECGRYSDDADTGEAICCPFCGAKMDKDGDGE